MLGGGTRAAPTQIRTDEQGGDHLSLNEAKHVYNDLKGAFRCSTTSGADSTGTVCLGMTAASSHYTTETETRQKVLHGVMIYCDFTINWNT